jgi:UMF1 family MFS transporter
VIAFSAIFAAQALGFPMERLIVLNLVLQVSALGGALAWSWPTDWLGPKRVVMITLAQWVAVVATAYFVETQAQFYLVAIVAGTGLGAIQAASRGPLARPIPPGAEAQTFGFTPSTARARRSWGRSCSARSRARLEAINGWESWPSAPS